MRRLSCLALAVLLTGCASSSGAARNEGTSPEPSTPPTPTAADTATVERVWDSVDAALITEETGVFRQESRLTRSDGHVNTITDGEFDLRGLQWKGRVTYASDSPTWRKQQARILAQQIDSVALKKHVYTTNSNWTGQIRGRWLDQVPPGTTQAGGTSAARWAASWGPPPLAALYQFVPTSARPADRGWTISGEVPARVGAVALGLDPTTTKVNLATLEGKIRMDVTVDPDYRPLTLTLSGKGLATKPALPQKLRSDLERTTSVTTFSRYGKAVEVTLPEPGQTFTDVSKLG